MKKSLLFVATLLCAASLPVTALSQRNLDEQILRSVKKATDYMINTVAYNGGFVWEYLPDLSRQWGEMEAYRTMAWTQGQGTPEMGQFFLDLYHATNDDFYYQAAEKCAAALIRGQHPSGGWNYIIDFAGDASLATWYATIGKNGWRLEEFQHYYGNCTYDDGASIAPAEFLLRLYVEKYDPRYLAAVERAIDFVLASQYPIGGWPQRFPLMYDHSKHGLPDYTSYITFNDGVHQNNVNFLMDCYRLLGDRRLIDPIRRAMHCTLALQQGPSQPGWADQYSLDYRPAGARTYEPAGIQTRTTAEGLHNLMTYYQWTGDAKFLARVGEGIDWLGKVAEAAKDSIVPRRLPEGRVAAPRFIEIGGERPVGAYRTGNRAANGRYHTQWGYGARYSDLMIIDLAGLKSRLEELQRMSAAQATAASPFGNTGGEAFELPKYLQLRPRGSAPAAAEVQKLLADLTPQGYWLVPMTMTSHPYIGDGSTEPEAQTTPRQGVPDLHDTSPFTPQTETLGITTRSYMSNVSTLMNYYLNK